MKEIFATYAKTGAMTTEQLADALKITPDMVRRMVKAGKVPRIPHMRLLRFDPLKMIDVFCPVQGADKSARSLTIKRHKTGAKGDFRKCL